MALHSQLDFTSAYVALQGFHQLHDPPRFLVLLVLVSVSLVILAKAGFFSKDASHYVSVYENVVGIEQYSGEGLAEGVGNDALAVAVLWDSAATKKLEVGFGALEGKLRAEQKSGNSDREASSCMISQELSMVKHDDEDGEEFNKRVEAYISKVRMRFNTESKA